MRLCTFLEPGRTRLGSVRGDLVQPLDGRDVRDALDGLPAESGPPVPLEGLVLAPPLVPGKLLGVGHNYLAHALERGVPIPVEPLIFSKLVTSVTGPADDVVRPPYTDGARLRGRARGRDRDAGAGRARVRRALARLRVRRDERHHRARPPADRAAVDARQGRRHVRALRAVDHDRRRGARPPGAPRAHLGGRRTAPGRLDRRHDVRRRRPDRVVRGGASRWSRGTSSRPARRPASARPATRRCSSGPATSCASRSRGSARSRTRSDDARGGAPARSGPDRPELPPRGARTRDLGPRPRPAATTPSPGADPAALAGAASASHWPALRGPMEAALLRARAEGRRRGRRGLRRRPRLGGRRRPRLAARARPRRARRDRARRCRRPLARAPARRRGGRGRGRAGRGGRRGDRGRGDRRRPARPRPRGLRPGDRGLRHRRQPHRGHRRARALHRRPGDPRVGPHGGRRHRDLRRARGLRGDRRRRVRPAARGPRRGPGVGADDPRAHRGGRRAVARGRGRRPGRRIPARGERAHPAPRHAGARARDRATAGGGLRAAALRAGGTRR